MELLRGGKMTLHSPTSAAALDLRLLIAGIEELDAGFSVFDAELRLVAANRLFHELLGFPAALCVSGTHFSAFLRDNAERGEYGPGNIEQQISERLVLARQFKPHRLDRARPDGRVIEIRGRPLPDGGLVTIYTDITEQKNRERALTELSQALEQKVAERTHELQQREADLAKEKTRLDLVINNIPVGITLVNEKLQMELSNRQFSEIMHFPVEFSAAATSFEAFIRHNAERGEYGPGDIEEQIRTRCELARQAKPHRFERIRPDGSAVEVIGNPTPEGGFVTTYLDITSRTRAEAALRASEVRFRDFANAASDWFFETDAEHRFTYFSDRLREITGLEPNGPIGKTREEMAGEDVFKSPEKWQLHRETLAQRKPFRDFDYPLRNGDGELRHIRVNGIPFFGADGRFAGYRGTANNVTEVKAAELKLRENEARLHAILNASPIGVAVVDRETCAIRFCNPRLAEQLGQNAAALLGQTAHDFFFDDASRLHLAGLCNGDSVDNTEAKLRRTDGSPWWALISIKPLAFEGSDAMLIWAYDISELHQAREQLSRFANHDALTSLPNRRYFELAAQRYLAHAKRHGLRGALLYFDLDGFKGVNDTYGHAVGDQLLQIIAEHIRQRLRETDFVARVGGDEFAILVENFLASHRDIKAFGQELISLISLAAASICPDIPVSASIGVALFDASGPALPELMAFADAAMYRAKSSGKNMVCISEPEDHLPEASS
jgi:diguanylate cyclase (GGDEF)-like protein/PAS domain S-box-containing protein